MSCGDVWGLVGAALIFASLVGRIWFVEAIAKIIPWPESAPEDAYDWSREDD
jgi:hypothetical protein